MATGDFIEGLSVTALADLQKYNTELVNTINNVDKVNSAFSKVKTPSGSNSAIKQLNEDYLRQSQVITELQNKIISLESTRKSTNTTLSQTERLTRTLADAQTDEALEVAKLKIQISEMNKENKAAAMQTLETLGAYQKMSSELNSLRLANKNLGAELYNMEKAGKKNSDSYVQLNSVYDSNLKKVTQLDAVLKKIDASHGQYGRSVGNYASGFNGLNNSIQQILREAPAAAVSLNTFFLGISNNLPMFFDEIQKINAGLKELKIIQEVANAEFAAQNKIVQESVIALRANSEAIILQGESIIANTGATAEQSAEINKQIAVLNLEIRTTGQASLTTLENTEALLLNAGANAEQVAAIRQKITATELSVAANAEAVASLEATKIASEEANAAVGKSPSLWKRLGESLFSINTLLSVGVLALTLYGGKLIEVIGNWFKGASESEALKESLEQLNNIRIESIKSVVKEGIQLNQNLKIAKNVNLSYKEREIAAKKVLDQYPYWFESLGKEAILNGNVEKAVKGVNDALLARAKANASVDKITANQSSIIDLEERRYTATKNLEAAQKGLLEIQKNVASGAGQGASGLRLAESEALRELESIQKEINRLTEINNRLLGYSNTEAEKAIGLDYKASKTDKPKRQKEEIDYLANAYALRKKNNEILAAEAERDMNNPELNFEDRRVAMENYYFQRQVAAEMAFEEEERLSELAFKKQQTTYKLAISEGRATQETLNQIEYQYLIDRQLNRTNFEEQSNQLTIEKAKALQGVLRSITDQFQKNALSQQSLNDLKQVGEYFREISGSSTLKDFTALDNKLREISKNDEDRKNQAIKIDLATNKSNQERINAQLYVQGKLGEQNEALVKLKQEELELNGQLAESDKRRAEEVASLYRTMEASTKSYLQSITDGFFSDAGFSSLSKMFDQVSYDIVNDLGEIETKTGSTFQKMIDQASSYSEKFAIAFNAISEVARETFEFLNQNSQAYFDNQYKMAEREYEIAKLFAGESVTAQKELEEQLADKKRNIRIEEAKQQKDMATFNAIISTAQAVASALPNLFLSALAGIIGGAQIALIQSQPLPEFWKGTDNAPQGFAWVDERGPEIHLDRFGKIKSLGSDKGANLRFLDAGDKIIPHNKFNEGLNQILLSNGINYQQSNNKQSQGLNSSDVVNIAKSVSESKEYSTVTISNEGFKHYIQKTAAQQQILNDTFSIKVNKIK